MLSYTEKIKCRNASVLNLVSFALDVEKPCLEIPKSCHQARDTD